MLIVLLFICLLPTVYSEIVCYSCISRINISLTTQDEQTALKTALYTRYNLPPSHENCAEGGNGLLFRTVEQVTCSGQNASCVKITSQDKAEEVSLTIRGCHSTILKSGFELGDTNDCNNNQNNKCVSLCYTALCNSSYYYKNYLAFVVGLIVISS